jgi:hypothetical protein
MRKLGQLILAAPAIIFFLLGVLRLLYVPCTWYIRRPYRAFPGELGASSVWIWNITTEHINYGLIAAQAVAIAVPCVALYAIIFLLWPQLRPSRLQRIFVGRLM